ncbi:MAG: HD domain-containing protein [Oscillospiraceae bacterium]|jgi:uncharacterized protein|nr:HD domain-containing protein [Oscillospiraceae bacterium]
MTDFSKIEAFMLEKMSDSAHDCEHVYRVLNYALDIAGHESGADYDVLITACLLHDIARSEQFANPALDHAEAGAEMAESWLLSNGHTPEFAGRVGDCIRAHRFRSNAPPTSLEAKILFDADKIDVCGAMGIVRTIQYDAVIARPVYTLSPDGAVLDGTYDEAPSMMKEYKFKLEKIYDKFFTSRGAELAAERRHSAVAFYNAILSEAQSCYNNGKAAMRKIGLQIRR